MIPANEKAPQTTPQSRQAGSGRAPKAIMDFRPSQGLASGLKRIGGRGGTTRLGKTERKTIGKARRGEPIVLHKY